MTSTVVVESARTDSSWVTSVGELARTDPDRVAVTGQHESLGYGELWRRASRLARALGDRPGVIGVDAVHTPETVVSLLGIWIAHGTYCPIDPGFPPDHAAALLASVGGRRLEDARRVGNVSEEVDQDTAYVLFTSGSTGRPKPVAVPHRALGAVVPALVELFDLRPSDRTLQLASLSWDTSFEEILPGLTIGAGVVFGCDAYRGSLSHLLRLVHDQRVTVLDLPTALWHELVLHLAMVGSGLPPSVRLVVIGGEAASPARLAAWHRLPGTDSVRLLNTYGATETALITHAIDLPDLPDLPDAATSVVPIGRPLAHVTQLISPEGELWVGGPSLASGYPGLAEATSERFVDVSGARFFRTGDLVRECDGVLEHAGRLDAQVKVRGIRVDPGEVEAHLLRHPGVAAAAVVGTTASDRTVLAAYVVPSPSWIAASEADLVADLRRFVRARAPGHLHPARVTVVPDLALTASGKVDRQATHQRHCAPPPAVPHRPSPNQESRR